MPIYFMTTALLIVSLVTNLTVEGIKKLLNETTIKYSSNVLAAVGGRSDVVRCMRYLSHHE